MSLLIASFVAGVLTILAPCILPVLPVIIGGAVAENSKQTNRKYTIILALGLSIFVFTMLLKGTTLLIGVPQFVWQLISGIIIIGLGVNYLYPKLWETVSLKTGAMLSSQQVLSKANASGGQIGAVMTGAALGPVFTSCSPTYLFIVAAILPANVATGTLYLLAYIIGLCGVLLLLAVVGARLTKQLKWALNPNGWFRRSIGVLMIVVGIFILIGADKSVQTFIIDQGWYAPVESIENSIR